MQSPSPSIRNRLSHRLYLPIIGVLLLGLALMGLNTYWAIQTLTAEKHRDVRQTYQNYVHKTLNSHEQIVLTNVIALANNPGLQKALALNDRHSAQQLLNDQLNQYRRYSGFKNIKVHLHTADFKSFLRSWKPDHYGDNLSPFRHALHHLALMQTPFASIELGREGILLRGFSLMKYEGRVVGSIEFIQTFEEIVQELNKQYGLDALILSSHDRTIDYFHTLTLVGTNRVLLNARPHNNQPLIQALSQYNFDNLEKEQQIIRPPFYFTSVPLYDFKEDKVGCLLIADDLQHVNSLIDSARQALYRQIMSLFLVDLLIIALLFILLRQRVIRPIAQLRAQLASINPYFGDADKLREILPLKSDHHDEFGALAYCLNLFFQRTSDTFHELAQARKLHQEALQNVLQPPACFKTDPQGCILHATPECLKLLQRSEAELVGQSFDSLVHSDTPITLLLKMQRTLHAAQPWQGILKLSLPDDQALFVRCSAHNETEGIQTYCLDNISELVKQHESLASLFRTHPTSRLGNAEKLAYDVRVLQQAYLAKLAIEATPDAMQNAQLLAQQLLETFSGLDYQLYQLGEYEFAVLANALHTPRKTFVEQMEHFLLAHANLADGGSTSYYCKLSIGVCTQHFGLIEQASKALQQAQQTRLPHVVVIPPLTQLQPFYQPGTPNHASATNKKARD